MKNRTTVIILLLSILVLFFVLPDADSQEINTVQIPQEIKLHTESRLSDSAVSSDMSGRSTTADQPKEKHTETVSEYERFIAGDASSDISTNISQFGYDLFNGLPSTFAAGANVPVGPGYVIGPGDEVRITVWGKVEGNWSVTVDRDGNISLPKIGVLGVTGLNFSELKKLLQKEFEKYFTGFEMNVSMGSLRSIRVYMVGNVMSPGVYTVSALSTLVNALFESGGPSKTGTMRNIQLKRNGKTEVSFDMYDLLLNGDRTNDIRLMPEDVIFIPTVGPLAGIAGNVKRPAIYELRGEKRLHDLVHMAGGLASNAFNGRVQVQRVEDHKFMTLFESDLVAFRDDPEKNFVLTDGDLVKVFSVGETKNSVVLTGAVANPGEYAIVPGRTRLSDVISKAGGLLYYASGSSELTRTRVTPEGPVSELKPVDISKALAGDPENDLPLEINDYIFVRTIPGWRLNRTVTVSGELKFPGTYTIRKEETLSSLLERAGDYTDNAYLRGAVFIRKSLKELQQNGLDEMFQRLEEELSSAGSSQLSTSLSMEEIAATKAQLEQRRNFMDSLKELKATGRMAIKLAHLRLLKGSEYDIMLEDEDTLYIPQKTSVVNVLGAVMSRGSFIYTENKGYKDYIEMSGGMTNYADRDNIYVLKVDGTAKKLNNGHVNWNSSMSRWEMEAFGKKLKEIEPGDSIVVSEKLDRIAWLREIKDVTQILYQIAITAGVAIVVF